MKLKNFFINTEQKIQGGISRFSSSFLITVAIFIILSIEALFEISEDWIYQSSVSLAFGLVFSIFFVIWGERLNISKKIIHLSFIIPTVICYLVMRRNIESAYFYMGYFGIIFALGCFSLCLLYSEKNAKNLIPHIVKNIFFSFLICVLLNIGIYICLWAIQTLIFDFDYEIYEVIAYFIWIVIFANTILAYLPKRDEEITLPKLFNTVIVKITLPVYLILIAILYVYLIKIVVTRNMPIGQINWFASFASLFFVFFTFCVKPYEDKLSKIFLKFSGFAIIPIVIMQLVAIYERVSAYGLTTPRSVSLILIGIAVIFAIVSILNKKTEKVWWAVGVIILVFTLIPKVNIIDMPKQSQISLLEKYLVKNNMLVNNEIVPNAAVEQADRERIISAYDYLMDSAGKLPDWLEDKRQIIQSEVLGFGTEYYQTYSSIEYCNYSNDLSYIDVSEYKSMYEFYDSGYRDNIGNIEFKTPNTVYTYDAHKLHMELYEKYGEDCKNIEPIKISENVYLFIKSSHFEYNSELNKLIDYSIGGYIFEK